MTVERDKRLVAVCFVVVALLAWLDQWSKSAVFAWLESGEVTLVTDIHGHRRHVLFGEWFSFMTSCNPGAAFGRFDSFPEVLVAGRVLAVGFLSWLLWRADTRHRVVLVAMTLVLAGAIGNVVDNLWTGCGTTELPFGVRDFINVWFEPLFSWDYHFPSFNVADSCISVGAVLWVTTGFSTRAEDEEAPGTDAGAASKEQAELSGVRAGDDDPRTSDSGR